MRFLDACRVVAFGGLDKSSLRGESGFRSRSCEWRVHVAVIPCRRCVAFRWSAAPLQHNGHEREMQHDAIVERLRAGSVSPP